MEVQLTSPLAAFALAVLAAGVWACTAGQGQAPPPPALRESAAAAGPSVNAAVSAALAPSRRGTAPSPTATAAPAAPELPALLSATGLYRARGAGHAGAPAAAAPPELHPDVIQFAPQYPLWTDGATKRRYLRLPAGTTIDASKPDAWVFPVGTRFWKEFSFAVEAGGARRVETRFIERRADGNWMFASYVWSEDGSDAVLAPDGGQRSVTPIGTTGLSHDIPSRGDCSICHEGAGDRAPILGFTALQLSPDRDGLAPHAEAKPDDALDLEQLIQRGLVVGYPNGTTEGPARPSIHADSPEARATLGYLHANCSSCHNRHGALADLELDFEQTVGEPDSSERVLRSLVQAPSRFRLPGAELRVVPGKPAESVVRGRLGSRSIVQQMPPLGSKVVDQEGTQLVTTWIQNMHQTAPSGARKETP